MNYIKVELEFLPLYLRNSILYDEFINFNQKEIIIPTQFYRNSSYIRYPSEIKKMLEIADFWQIRDFSFEFYDSFKFSMFKPEFHELKADHPNQIHIINRIEKILSN
jgi:hypothetical protein